MLINLPVRIYDFHWKIQFQQTFNNVVSAANSLGASTSYRWSLSSSSSSSSSPLSCQPLTPVILWKHVTSLAWIRRITETGWFFALLLDNFSKEQHVLHELVSWLSWPIPRLPMISAMIIVLQEEQHLWSIIITIIIIIIITRPKPPCGRQGLAG